MSVSTSRIGLVAATSPCHNNNNSSNVSGLFQHQQDHQQSQQQRFLHLYRKSIFLNNAGVWLLERGCYVQAIDTLKDSIQALQQVVSSIDGNSSSSSSSSSSSDIQTDNSISSYGDEMVQKANGRLAHPTQQVQGLMMGMEVRRHSPRLETVFYQDCFVPFLNSPHSVTTDGGTLRPARIEPIEFSLEDASTVAVERNVDIDMALIFNNFGLACYLQSTTEPMGSAKHEKLVDTALSVFNMAAASITNLYNSSIREEFPDPSTRSSNLQIESVTIVSLALLVTRNLCHLYALSGHVAHSVHLYGNYENIRRAVIEQCDDVTEFLDLIERGCSTTAPAA